MGRVFTILHTSISPPTGVITLSMSAAVVPGAPARRRSRVTYAVLGPSAVVHSVVDTPAGGRGAGGGGRRPG